MSDHNPMAGENADAAEAINNVINTLGTIETMLTPNTKPQNEGEDAADNPPPSLATTDIEGLRNIISCCKGACEDAYHYHLKQLGTLAGGS